MEQIQNEDSYNYLKIV